MATMLSFLSLCAFLAVGHVALATTEVSSSATTKSSCLVNTVFDLALKLKDQSWQLRSLKTKMAALETRLLGNTEKIMTIHKCNKSVAFSARYDKPLTIISVGHAGTLKYPKIVTNIGDGYNSVTGYFTAPYKGTYAFYTSLRSSNDKPWILLAIFKGSTQLAEATGDGSADKWDRGNIFVTTPMDKGEIAYVRQIAGSTYLEAGRLTTFSGFLLACD